MGRIFRDVVFLLLVIAVLYTLGMVASHIWAPYILVTVLFSATAILSILNISKPRKQCKPPVDFTEIFLPPPPTPGKSTPQQTHRRRYLEMPEMPLPQHSLLHARRIPLVQ